VNVALLIGNLSTTADMIRAPPTDDFGWVILYTGQGLFGWLCRIATIVLIVGVLAVPALAIVASGRHIFDRIAASRGATASTVGNQLLLIDLPTTWIYICVVVFTAVIVANFVMHIRLKTAIKKARGSGLP
jgi:hypothetical protein